MDEPSRKISKLKTTDLGPGFFYWQKGKIAGPVESLEGGLRYGYDKQTVQSKSKPERKSSLSKEISEKITLLNESTAKALKEFNESYQENLNRLTKIDGKYLGSETPSRPQPIKRETAQVPVSRVATIVPEKRVMPHQLQGNAHSDSKPIAHTTPDIFRQKITFSPCYLTLKGQLRLGTYRSPFKVAFVTYFTSLCLGSYFWNKATIMDIHWHVDQNCHKSRSASLLGLLSLIPGLWCVAYFLVSREILKMEKQNGDPNVWTWWAAILGLVPPLAIYYLQNKVNEHWQKHILHVKNRRN